MRKIFEFFLVLIIFYGVYVAFDRAAPVVFDNPKTIWTVLTSLVVAALVLVLYNFIIGSELKSKMKKNISDLKLEIKQKDEAIKKAQTFKEDLINEAEDSELVK